MYCCRYCRTGFPFSCGFLMCLLLVAFLAAPSDADDSAHVVIVHSYNAEYVWTQQINKGIQDVLADHATIDRVFYMDAKRRPDTRHLQRVALDVFEYIEKKSPQVVICVDDAAQLYLVDKYLKGRKSPQVVFCGVNAPLEKYGYPASNVSGVRERWHYRDAFALMKKIVPEARSVAFLVEDSESGGYVLDDLLQEQKQNGPFALKLVGAEKVTSLSQWKKRITHYDATADVLALGLYNSILDEKSGKVAEPDAIMDWTNSVITRPTIGFSDVAKEHSLLCGILESGYEQGYLAGKMALQIIVQGTSAGELPVQINSRGIVFLNLRTAARLGVRIPYKFIEAAGEILQ